MEAATARTAPARSPAPRRRPRPRPRQRPRPARTMRPAVSALPQAAVRSVGAVRDISDSGLIVRLTRGRGWIAVLCALLGGIVALNVLSLSLSAGSGRISLQVDELKTDISALQAQIDERLSASQVEAEAARLGLAVPDPKAISYLSADDGNAQRLAHLLATDGFLLAPSQPSSYPTESTTYEPTSSAATPTPTTTVAPSTTTGSSSTGTATPTIPSSGTSSGTAPTSSSGTGSSSGAATGGVGL
jgi:hypothetical protein